MAASRRTHRPRLTLVLLVLASITIITLDYRGDTKGIVGKASAIAHDALAPIERATDAGFRPIGGFLAGALHGGAIESENARLRSANGALERKVVQTADIRRRLAQLARLDHLPWAGNLPSVAAQVVAQNASNFEATIQLDKGTDNGVEVGMPVVAGAGLVGRVVAVWHTGCTVQLITDVRSNVGVRFGPQGDLGLVAGRGQGRSLAVDLVAPGTPLHRGEVLFTSGLQNALFPPGIPVAWVSSFSSSSSASQESVSAEPSADLAVLSYVSVLQWQPAS